MSEKTHNRLDLCPAPDSNPHGPTCFSVPRGAVDTHAHVIGGPPRYPLVDERSYTPPPATPEDYLHMLDATGMTYGVLVQVSVHGTDNRLMLEVLSANPNRLRGIAVAPADLPDRAWQALDESGVRGLRLNTLTGGGMDFSEIDRYESICAELGWHLEFLITPASLKDVAPRLRRLRIPYVIDHMGHLAAAEGIESSNMKTMIGLLSDGAWTKVSGAYRLSESAPFADTIPIARRLIDVAPDRCIWGSDWPQPGYLKAMPNIGDLLDLLGDWAPDPKVRDAILTTNAQRLFGFPRS